jgi:tRNA threonylcarbamoyl adenosine modification protein YeaZ
VQDPLTGRTLIIATGHAMSLALVSGGAVLASRHEEMVAGHAERLVPALAELLGGPPAMRCDRVIAEVGPGSFTGLRVGVAAARALGLAWSAALTGVRSTVMVAARARAEGIADRLTVALKAPRGQIWVERFAAGGLESAGPPVSVAPDALDALAAASVLVGTAARDHRWGPDARWVPMVPEPYFGEAALLYVRPPLPVPGAP